MVLVCRRCGQDVEAMDLEEDIAVEALIKFDF